MRVLFFVLFIFTFAFGNAQNPTVTTKQDSTTTQTKKKKSPFSTGFYPLGFFDVDLRYLIKYNNYEALRLGIGGITNDRLSNRFRIGGYFARGFKDRAIKFSAGGSLRLDPKSKTWINLYYIDDIREVGSFDYLTDARVYSIFEPRLVNITQFFKHRTWQTNVQSQFHPKVLSEFRFSHSRIDQILNYRYINDDRLFRAYETAEVTASVRYSPKTEIFTNEDGNIVSTDYLPKISFQVTHGIKGIVDSDFNYTKLGLKLDYNIRRTNLSSTNIVLEGDLAIGDVPLTHLFHAYPNSPTKDEILQRFSVAGTRGFETMYFGEFFSDKLSTIQIRHSLRRFYIASWLKPELVLITRHAIGDMSNTQNHRGVNFGTLDQFYSESGFEINKLIFGFGLSFAYRYGYYNLPDFEDNVAFKFTFYLKL